MPKERHSVRDKYIERAHKNRQHEQECVTTIEAHKITDRTKNIINIITNFTLIHV